MRIPAQHLSALRSLRAKLFVRSSNYVELRGQVTALDKRRITAVPFSAVFVSSAGSHPEVGMDPNTY